MVDLSCQSADAMVDLSGQLECVSIVVFMCQCMVDLRCQRSDTVDLGCQ